MQSLVITNRTEVRKRCGRTEEEVLNDIQIIKKWLEYQKHLPEVSGDNMIEVFLFNNKFSIEKTKERLDMYYTIRNLMPEVYENINPDLPLMKNVSETLYHFPLPKLTKDLFRVSMVKFKKENVDIFDAHRMLAYGLNLYEVRLQEDLALGEILVCDYEYLKMGHVTKLTPMYFKNFAIVVEKVTSIRLKQMHVINYPPFADILISLAKSILSEKLSKRIYLHKSLESLIEYVPLEILPKDYGGMERTMDDLQAAWNGKLTEYRNRFEELDRMKVNESLRPKPLENSDILGYYGNFKKLNVD